jgi:hypothetical protein
MTPLQATSGPKPPNFGFGLTVQQGAPTLPDVVPVVRVLGLVRRTVVTLVLSHVTAFLASCRLTTNNNNLLKLYY